jgi:hypothetical protein
MIAAARHPLARFSGVSPIEARDSLPGDDIVLSPMWQSTRAITIAVPAEQV